MLCLILGLCCYILTFTSAVDVYVHPDSSRQSLVPETNDGRSETRYNLRGCDGCKLVLSCVFTVYKCDVTSIDIHDGILWTSHCPETIPFLLMHSVNNEMTLIFKNDGLRVGSYCTVISTKPYLNVPEPRINSHEDGILSKGKIGTTCKCGWTNKRAGRIYGGTDASPNEYPFPVLIVFRSNFAPFCGGSIITPYHVLTAAHCTQPYKGRPLSVVVGDHDISIRDETPYTQLHDVKRTIEYPTYNMITNQGDIAVLELVTRIQFNDIIGPVCLAKEPGDLLGKFIKVMGWGLTKDPTENGKQSPTLKKVNLRVIHPDVCNVLFNIETEPLTQICTYNNRKDSCRGDSGGPLVHLDPLTNAYHQVAIVSYGKMCGSTDPSVNTDVKYYMDWIEEQVVRSNRGVEVCY